LNPRPVPFVDVAAMMRVHGEAMERALVEVVQSAHFINGPKVEELEQKLAGHVGVDHAIACGSGTAAEQLLLMALGVGPGDEVIVPDFTFIATAEAVALVGATPVCVDVDPRTFTLDPDAVRAAMGPRVKAIVPVSLYGQPAAMDVFESIAEDYGVFCLEDACQSLGSRLGNRQSGSFGTAGFTSFYPSKPLGGIGDGGMIFTNDAELAEELRLVREHGQIGRHVHRAVGLNSRLDALQAAALLVKYEGFEQEIERRRHAARRYDESLASVVQTPFIAPGRYSSFAQYTILLADADSRDSFVSFLADQGVPTALHYPQPVHTQDSLSALLKRRMPTPIAHRLCDTVISLPISAYMSMQDQDRVISAVLEWAEMGNAAAVAGS
jgi:UDP-2-acetamido-2-deoxy-ribo-hexuluronate aminotransferase